VIVPASAPMRTSVVSPRLVERAAMALKKI
jgi:hypothetical protein